jgi:hypothetical protein
VRSRLSLEYRKEGLQASQDGFYLMWFADYFDICKDFSPT